MTNNPIIIALDVDSAAEADALVDALGPAVDFYKVGMELFAATGMDYVRNLSARGKRVFLDMKYYDIGETVRRAVAVVAKSGAYCLTVHAAGQVMRAAAEGRGSSELKLLAVTVLTSFDQSDIEELGHSGSVSDLVATRARQAMAACMDGVIASPMEAAAVRSLVGGEALIITPGVRSAGIAKSDQKRVMTPAEAIHRGASHIVVGRQVTRAADPAAAFAAIQEELRSA